MRPPSGDFPEPGDDGVLKDVGQDARDAITGHVLAALSAAKTNRESNGVDEEFTLSLYQVRAQYTPDVSARLKAKGIPEIFLPMTDTKCRGLLARLSEIVSRDDVLEMRPSAIPEPPPDAIESIALRAMQPIRESGMKFLEMAGVIQQLPPEMLEAAAIEAGLMLTPPEHIQLEAARLRAGYDKRLAFEAEEKARLMTATIREQLNLGKHQDAIGEALENMIVYGTGFLHGPVPAMERRLGWRTRKKKSVPVFEDRLTLAWKSVQPWDVFPQAGVTDMQQGDLCVRVRYFPEDLRNFAEGDCPGYIPDAISAALSNSDEKKDTQNTTSDTSLDTSGDEARKSLTLQSNPASAPGQIEGVEYWGNLPGHLLAQLGIEEDAEGKTIKANRWLAVNTIVAHKQLIYLRLLEPGELRPYSKACCYTTPGSFWGTGVPKKMRVSQTMINLIARFLAVNVSHSAGPQVIIDSLNRLDKRINTQLEPLKVWLFNNSMGNGNRPMYMQQVQDNSHTLIAALDRWIRQTDEDTGIPAVAYGNSYLTGAAARTARGLSMVMEGVEKVIRDITRRVDDGLLRTSMQRMYVFNMLYSDDEAIKCDASPEARGVLAVALRQQQAGQYAEILQMVKGDPVSQAIVGAKGMLNLFRKTLQCMGVNPDDLDIPSATEQELAQIQQNIVQAMMLTQSQRDGAQAQQQAPTAAQMQNAAPAAMQRQPMMPPQARQGMMELPDLNQPQQYGDFAA